jgi:hypothetical protein
MHPNFKRRALMSFYLIMLVLEGVVERSVKLINPWLQAKGIADAVSFVKKRDGDHNGKIILWGDSFAGMLVLTVGALVEGLGGYSFVHRFLRIEELLTLKTLKKISKPLRRYLPKGILISWKICLEKARCQLCLLIRKLIRLCSRRYKLLNGL